MSPAQPYEPTLADLALRQTFGKPRHRGIAHKSVRAPLLAARRFVLDQDASSFLCDLANANFHKQNVGRALRAYEASRVLARLPYTVTWIEYDAIAEFARYKTVYPALCPCCARLGNAGKDPTSEDPTRMGWLLQQHPQIETAFRMTAFVDFGDNAAHMHPLDFVWVTDDGTPPWLEDLVPGEDLTNLTSAALGFLADYANGNEPVLFKPPEGFQSVSLRANATTHLWPPKELQKMMVANGQELRKALTLLAAINDVPIGVRHVEPSRGFIAQGRYRKFLDHNVITVTLPKGRDPQKVARQIIAKARRRAHQVRGHWRRDWRHEGLRIWIKEHQRGDASLGFVTHDYRVEHPEA
jgi:hypothetical protein